VSPLESWVTDRWNTSIDFLWTFLINCSQLALLLRRSTYLPVTLEKYISYQHRDSDNPYTHIMCVSWIMSDGRMEYIYWLLLNFPDKLLTSCTSIEKVNLPSIHIGKIYYINTGIVTFLTHILCVSLESWVTDGWNTSIDFLYTFMIICSRVALLLRRSTYLPVTLEKHILSTPGQ
jgi:hypothetical protein